jgi:hypothetical protein
MKHISVVLYDVELKSIIEHECMPEGELILSSGGNEGFIDILMGVEEISLELKIFNIVSRRFSIDKNRLIINVIQKNK